MERNSKQRHTKSRSGGGGGVLASFLRSTAATFSSSSFSTTTSSVTKKRSSFNHRNAFSGPIMVSIVPPEARGRRRSGRRGGGTGYRTPEPSSPKVSCIGQIKKSGSKTKKPRNKVKPCGEDGGACPLPPRPPPPPPPFGGCRPKSSLVRRMFFRRSRSRSSSSLSKSSGATTDHGFKGRSISTAVAAEPAPAGGLGQMKRFTSGRAVFQDFDWTEPVERRGSDDDDDDYEDDGFVAHSAPLVLGDGMVASEPRKEVNLWRRRPMSPPTRLELP